MIEAELDHCQIVAKSINGERQIDEQTSESLVILSERLQRLKKLGKHFSGISFSLAVKKLTKQKNAVAVG